MEHKQSAQSAQYIKMTQTPIPKLVLMLGLPTTISTNMLFQSVGKNKEATLLASLRSGLALMPTLLILSSLMGLLGIEYSQSVADIITWTITMPFAVWFIKKLPGDEEEMVK